MCEREREKKGRVMSLGVRGFVKYHLSLNAISHSRSLQRKILVIFQQIKNIYTAFITIKKII